MSPADKPPVLPPRNCSTTDRCACQPLCRVLEEDPDLLLAVPELARERAVVECVAPVIRIGRGRWSQYRLAVGEPAGIGLLVLEGLLIRRVGIDGRFGAELLGEGDLLRPWQQSEIEPNLPRTTGWRVLEATRLAVLDARVAYRLARYPLIAGCLVGRALERSRNLAVNMAIVHQPRIHVRLHMLFWHLADRWGRVGPNGIRLPIRLTHTVLAELVAARRPSVSSALADLSQRRLIDHAGKAWLLRGDPPRELLEVHPVAAADREAQSDGRAGIL